MPVMCCVDFRLDCYIACVYCRHNLVVYHVHVYLFSYFSRLLSRPYKIFILLSHPACWMGRSDYDNTTRHNSVVQGFACTASQPVVVTCCLTINSDLTWQAHVHGQTVKPSARSPLSSVPEKLSGSTGR